MADDKTKVDPQEVSRRVDIITQNDWSYRYVMVRSNAEGAMEVLDRAHGRTLYFNEIVTLTNDQLRERFLH